MDKSFNDDELADIMSEIENLEKEVAELSDHAPSSAPEAEVSDHGEEESHTSPEVLSHLADKSEDETVLKTNHDEDNIVSLKPASAAHSSMSFRVEGEMKVSLAIEVNGQQVSLDVTEDGLHIELESGASFHLPLQAHKKVA
jgi:hypothetical protein